VLDILPKHLKPFKRNIIFVVHYDIGLSDGYECQGVDNNPRTFCKDDTNPTYSMVRNFQHSVNQEQLTLKREISEQGEIVNNPARICQSGKDQKSLPSSISFTLAAPYAVEPKSNDVHICLGYSIALDDFDGEKPVDGQQYKRQENTDRKNNFCDIEVD
jgi:hypothetical protein